MHMTRLRNIPQLANIAYLHEVAIQLRKTTTDVAKEELPQDLAELLKRLAKAEGDKVRPHEPTEP